MKLTSLVRRLAALTSLAAVVLSAPAVQAQIAIVNGGFYTSNLKNQLVGAGLTVTEINSYNALSLAAFDAVIHYGNSSTDTAALESFVSGGGRLVLTPWSGLNFHLTSNLALFSNGGNPVYSAGFSGANVLAPADFLLSGVTFPPAGTVNVGYISGISFHAAATQVATYGNGVPFLAHRTYGAGEVVGINMHVITSDTAYTVIDEPWATQLLVNAVGGTINAPGAVPEPSTYGLIGAGALLAVVALRRRKKV